MTRYLTVVVVGLLSVSVMATGCSSSQPGAATRPSVSGGHYVLTEAELQAANDLTLYDAIQRLRPTFLRSRQIMTTSTPNPEPVHVFVDGTRAEGLNTLPQNLAARIEVGGQA